MKIYTKRGDQGETSLFGGQAVPKDHLRIQAYGCLDTLNSYLGLALAETRLNATLRAPLTRIQAELFQLGAELATPRGKTVSTALIDDIHVTALEKEIDAWETQLEPLKNFILPGGSREAALLHVARTHCREAERHITTLHRAEPCRGEVIRYINRLSDALFVAARYANFELKVSDVPWK
jgi:cob(I)alamin adenosyltransferase